MLGTSPEMRGGIASVVAALRDAGLFERSNVRYVVTHVEGGYLRKSFCFVGATARALRMLMSGDVTVVHAHVSSRGSFWRKALLLWLARRFGVATIFHLHDGRFAEFAATGFGGGLLRRCIRRTLETSSLVIVLSARWRDWVRGFAPRARVRVIGNPVRCPPDLEAIKQRNPQHSQVGRILFLGKIGEHKGAFDLIEAFARFDALIPGWRLAVGGNGDVERFLAEAQRLGVRDSVDYLGWVTGRQKDFELAATDIFVLPSYGEGMPMSVLEAMAFGLALITTPVGGIPDLMQPDRHGLWVNPGDVPGLVQCLERLANSPELRARLGAAARQHVQAVYAVENIVAQIHESYVDVVESGRR